MGRRWRRLTGQDARELAWAEKGLRELQAKNDALKQELAAFRARAGRTKGWVGCQLCGYHDGHSPECRYRHFRAAGKVIPCPECGGTRGIHKAGCLEVELNLVQRKARERLGPTGAKMRKEPCPTETREFASSARPKLLPEEWPPYRRFGCWYWVVAGRQFCCSFSHKETGASSRARLALVRYVRGFLPEPAEDAGAVEGPCCIKDGADYPLPLPEDRGPVYGEADDA